MEKHFNYIYPWNGYGSLSYFLERELNSPRHALILIDSVSIITVCDWVIDTENVIGTQYPVEDILNVSGYYSPEGLNQNYYLLTKRSYVIEWMIEQFGMPASLNKNGVWDFRNKHLYRIIFKNEDDYILTKLKFC